MAKRVLPNRIRPVMFDLNPSVPIMDFFVACIWLLVNVGLIYGCAIWANVLWPEESFSSRALSTLILALSCIVALISLQGTLNLLQRPYFVAAAVVLVVTILSLGLRQRRQMPRLKSPRPIQLDSPVFWIWISLGGFLISRHGWNGLLELPTQFDSLGYHLPLINHWIQDGSLFSPKCSNWFLPANNEAVAFWFVAPFSGDFLVALNNVPVVLVLAFATFRLGESLGLPTLVSHGTTVIALLVRPVWHQILDASNDLAVVAYFIAALVYLLRYSKFQQRCDMVFFGLCLGLLAGVKYFAIGYAILLLCQWFLVRLFQRQLKSDFFRQAGCILATSCLTGGYWYIRNLVVSGSPIYPLLAGGASASHHPRLLATTLAGNGDPSILPLAFAAVWRMSTAWHFLALCLLPIVLVLLIWDEQPAPKQPATKRAVPKNLILSTLLVGTLFVLVLTPFAVEDRAGSLNHLKWAYTPVRYGLCSLTITAVALVYLIDRLLRRYSADDRLRTRQTMLGWMLGFIALAQAAYRMAESWHYFQFAQIGLLAFVLVAGFRLTTRIFDEIRNSNWFPFAGALLVACLAGGISELSARWHAQFDNHFDGLFRSNAFSCIAQMETPQRVCVLDRQVYPFFGSRREHWVTSLRTSGSINELIQFSCSHKLTLLVTRSDTRHAENRYQATFEKLSSAPDRFEYLDSWGPWRLFRVKSSLENALPKAF